MPVLTVKELTTALAVVGAVAAVAFVVALVLTVRLARLRRNYLVLRGNAEPVDIFGVVGRFIKQIESLDERFKDLATTQEAQARANRMSVQRFGLVRYDAFEDMGGRLSFSAALLDDHGDGLVITSINGRTETRTYAKPIKNLKSQHNLSQEENAAIAAAMTGQGRADVRVPATR